VHFEAGAVGQRLYLGAEALGWNATGIGAFYDDDVHRYLGFLEETNNSVIGSVDAAEKRALVMLGSPTSRHAAAISSSDSDKDSASENQKVRANNLEVAPGNDSSKLPRQVIYHFSIGRAIPDPRIEA
jgi:nitroreductase